MKKQLYSSWRVLAVLLLCSSGACVGFAQTAFAFAKQRSGTDRQGATTGSQMVRLKDALKALKEHYKVDIIYGDQSIDLISVSADEVKFQQSLEKNLSNVLRSSGLKFKKVKDGTYLILGKSQKGGVSDIRFPETPGSINSQLVEKPVENGKVDSQSTENAVVDDIIVKGIVKDTASGEALPGVSIVVKGTSRGTSTNATGEYSIAVPDKSSGAVVLVFSFVGYQKQEVTVGNQTRINVNLRLDDKTLNEVVVVGYGVVRKSDLTGSLAQVKGKELNAFPATNVLQALSGRAPGVQVLQNTGAPGGSISVRIRGTNSIQGSNEPLYVVDGFPIAGTNPTVLNNSDIESMEILKDASATAIYGSRGANGVVIITTKQGKAGQTQVSYESSYSVQTLRKKLDLMNAKEFATFYNEQAANDKLATPYFTQAQIDALGAGYDWESLIFRKAPMQTHNLTVSGGSEKTRFSVGGSLLNQDGIIIGSNYKRYSLRANITTDVNKKFSLSYGATLTNITTSQQNSGGGNRGGSLISSVLSLAPITFPYNDDGSIHDTRVVAGWIGNITNPLSYVNQTSNNVNSNQILANAAITFRPVEGMAIKLSGGIENNDDRNDAYTSNQFPGSLGSASVSTNRGTSLLSENTISYNKLIRQKHSISAVAGFTYQDFLNRSLSAGGTGFLSDLTQTDNLAAASTPAIPGSSYSLSTLLSYLGRVNYGYDGKYLATISFRADGSSKYSDGSKWGYFPSGAVAWRVSQEEFLKDVPFLSDLKLRASWGKTGSQAISAYATLNNLNAGKTVFGDALYNSFSPGTRLPSNLKWETTEQTDFGMDAAFFGNRLRFTADYYIKHTRDLLNTIQLPTGFGYTSTLGNVGQIDNKGLELAVDGRVIDKAFKWDLSGNIAFNRSKVVKLYGGKDILGGSIAVTLINDASNLLREGQPVGVFYGYQENGYTDKGQIAYKDLNGDGVINQNDKTIIGNPNPNYIFGFNSTMSYKGFDLILFLQGSQGNDLVNVSSVGNTLDYGFGINMLREVYNDHWTPTHTNAKYPVISRANTYSFSNRLIENGSYIRLRTIQLAYNLPVQKWGTKWLRSAQVYTSAQNFLTITKYSWWDPEVNSQGGANSIGQGIDHYSYPTAKSITFGVRVGF